MRTTIHRIAVWLIVLTVLISTASTVSYSQSSVQDGNALTPRLRKVVVLSRHGIRAPTQSGAVLELWSARSWPRWPVRRGYLTPRGGLLVTAMWENMRTRYVEFGLLPAAACPPPRNIFVHADVDQRTRETARALLDGLAPACGLTYAVSDLHTDPLFHPVKSGLYAFDPATVTADVLAMAGGSLETAQEELAPALRRIGDLAAPPDEEFCARYHLPSGCAVADAPSYVRVSPAGRSVSITGALGVASDMAEIFLLEYGQWPDRPAAWGQANQQVMSAVLPVHTRIFNIVNRAPVVAWARGAALLRAINDALEGNHADPHYNDAALVFFVGHDTNLANVGALLDLHWQPPDYPSDSTPPAAALCFELWEYPPEHPGQKGEREVRIQFYAQPLATLHSPLENPSAATLTHAPDAAVMAGQAQFRLEDFTALVLRKTVGAPLPPPEALLTRSAEKR